MSADSTYVQWAELCPNCERHFTDMADHHSQPCAPVAILEIEPVEAPDFTFKRWIDVFWSRVKRGGPYECWPWMNATDSGGYGAIGVPKQFRDVVPCSKSGFGRAHRIAYALESGTRIAGSVVIRHGCNNRICCNPAHLLLGNQGENMNDVARTNRGEPLFASGGRK